MIHANLHDANGRSIKWLIDGNMEDPGVSRLMHTALLHYQNLAIGHGTAGVDDFRLERPGFKIRSVFGGVTIHIQVPPVGGEMIEVIQESEIEREEILTKIHVLLVEMRAESTNWTEPPDGFAVFVPTGGQESIQARGGPSMDMIAPGLRCYGYTTSMVENIMGEHDPPGMIGQPTFRQMWCKDISSDRRIEQVKRIDQGTYAYDGEYYGWDPERGYYCEVTELNAQYIWTYEGIEYPTRFYSADPGPPPYSFCHYTWAPWESQSPDGDDTAGYHSIERLFYRIEHPGGDIISCWPEEFNQLIVHGEQYHDNTCLHRYVESDNPEWDLIYDQGFEALGEIMLPNTFSKWTNTSDETERVWGHIWGVQGNPSASSDVVAGEPTDFPYLKYETRETWRTDEQATEYGRSYPGWEGVYVNDGPREMFVNGVVLATKSEWEEYHQDYLMVHVREPQSADRFTNPSGLTARQRELMEGNVDGNWFEWYLEGEDRLYTEGAVVNADHWFCVNAGGEEFVFGKQELLGHYYLNGILYEDKSSTGFGEYGIFTKEGTGIKTDTIVPQGETEPREMQVVDPETVQPIYTYVTGIGYGLWGGGSAKPTTYIWGMVMDGKNYATEEYPGRRTIPELEGAKTKSGEPMYATSYNRVGVLELSKKSLKEIVGDEEETKRVWR